MRQKCAQQIVLAPKCIYHGQKLASMAQIQSDVRKRENYELSPGSAASRGGGVGGLWMVSGRSSGAVSHGDGVKCLG